MNSGIYVLIIAKPGSLRRGLQSLISSLAGISAVGLVDNYADALQMTQEIQPALAILASENSGNQILKILPDIKRLSPETKCIMLLDSIEDQEKAYLAGADAAILHGTSPDELVFRLEAVLNQARGEKRSRSGASSL